jgi:hypothetical protein
MMASQPRRRAWGLELEIHEIQELPGERNPNERPSPHILYGTLEGS